MTAVVIDSSAALAALVARPVNTDLSKRLRLAAEIHAPHFLDVEVLNGLRRLVMFGDLSADRASEAVGDLWDLSVIRYPHIQLAERIWILRDNLTAHDACFVALAESLELPLITCDAKMASAPGIDATIELFSPRGQRSASPKRPGRARRRR